MNRLRALAIDAALVVLGCLILGCGGEREPPELWDAHAEFGTGEHFTFSMTLWPSAGAGQLEIDLVAVTEGDRAREATDGESLGCRVHLPLRDSDFRHFGDRGEFNRRLRLAGTCRAPAEGQRAYARFVYRVTGGRTFALFRA